MARSGPEDRLHARPYSRNTSPELTAGPDWNIWVDLSAPLQSLHYKDESEMRRLHTIVGSDGPDGRIIRDTAKSRYVCAKQSYVYNVSFTLRCSCSDRNTCVITDLADVYRFSIHTPKKSVHAFRLRVPEVRHQTVRIPCGSRIHYSFRTPFRLVAGHGLWIRFAASNLQIFRHAWKKPMGKSASVSKNEPLTTCAWRIFERMVFPRPRTRLLIGIFKYHCSATVSIHRTPRQVAVAGLSVFRFYVVTVRACTRIHQPANSQDSLSSDTCCTFASIRMLNWIWASCDRSQAPPRALPGGLTTSVF
jgi:hypothetical protein